MVVLEVAGGILLLVGALVALDWFTAGRAKGRMLVRAKDQSADNAGVGYAGVERNLQAGRDWRGPATSSGHEGARSWAPCALVWPHDVSGALRADAHGDGHGLHR